MTDPRVHARRRGRCVFNLRLIYAGGCRQIRPMDFSGFLKLFSIAVAAALGVLGVVFDFRTKDSVPKITRWGRFAIGTIGLSALVALYVQYGDLREERERRFRAAASEKSQTSQILEIVKGTEKTMSEVKRAQTLLVNFRVFVALKGTCEAEIFLETACSHSMLTTNPLTDYLKDRRVAHASPQARMIVVVPSAKDSLVSPHMVFNGTTQLDEIEAVSLDEEFQFEVTLVPHGGLASDGHLVSLQDLSGLEVAILPMTLQWPHNETSPTPKLDKWMALLRPLSVVIKLPDGEQLKSVSRRPGINTATLLKFPE